MIAGSVMKICLQEVTRSFGTQSVIEPITLEIANGDFLSILGPSGCGKSTLLRTIAGLDQPSSGRIGFSPEFIERGHRAFVFQESHLIPWRTALRNVMVPLELMRVPKSECVERARWALERVSLRGSENLYPGQLSGGMKMRVSLARALVSKPRLLLLDEPFAALDEGSRHALQEELRELWRSLEMTVVFVTHSVTEAVFLSTRALVLSGRPARVITDRRIHFAGDLNSKDGAGRNFETRTSSRFNEEVRAIHSAMQRGAV